MEMLDQRDAMAVSGGVRSTGPQAPTGPCAHVDPSLDPICPGPEPEQLM